MLIALIGFILFCGGLYFMCKDDKRVLLAMLLLPTSAVLMGLGCALMQYEQDYCQPNMRTLNGVHYQCIQGAEYVALIGRNRNGDDYPIWQPILINGSPKKCTY